ncbi:L-type lectin-domain containing receptor kinase IV.1-like [Macadamia integrifolia]|uniref:L-type lectin-domain containing receptor kinase IV.1-like n=1 Tax=Macadamia integrifolia TaxID=60698 RepID=UPI001C4E4900|nr:L-type lectin-domain containing receptor kinase IV.1-like [Macadamia integrifolia]
MLNKFMVLFLLFWRYVASQEDDLGFTYNGFEVFSMSLDGCIARGLSRPLQYHQHRRIIQPFHQVDLDCLKNSEFNDIDGNHVGIDVNDLRSVESAPASYFSDQEKKEMNIDLSSIVVDPYVCVEYSGAQRQLNVTLASIDVPKPTIPLLSLNIDLSSIVVDPMFVGFSSATHAFKVTYYVLGWSFKMNGKAKELTLSQLPKLPRFGPQKKSKFLNVGLPVIGTILLLILIFVIQFIMKRKKKFADVIEDWEFDYKLHRFKYKDLYIATKGFKDKELLGVGGFGRVYKGVLPKSKVEVAVKSVSYNSRQGEKQFVAEIVSIELCRTGKANPSVDVFAFGAFLLEVACGRRPIEPQASEECVVLVDWVLSCWSKGMILHTVDPKLGMDYDVQEIELVLELGLLCSHSIPTERPHMRQVVRYLEGEVPISELTLLGLSKITNDTTFESPNDSGDVSVYLVGAMTRSSSVTESVLSGGR